MHTKLARIFATSVFSWGTACCLLFSLVGSADLRSQLRLHCRTNHALMYQPCRPYYIWPGPTCLCMSKLPRGSKRMDGHSRRRQQQYAQTREQQGERTATTNCKAGIGDSTNSATTVESTSSRRHHSQNGSCRKILRLVVES